MPLLREFLNENIHRSYPFENQNSIPTPLIVDFGIIATESVPNNSDNTGTTYINKIVTDGVTVQVGLGIYTNDAYDLGFIATAEINGSLFQTKRFQIATTVDSAGVVLEGFIVFGDLSVTKDMPPVTSLDQTTGKVYTGCIQTMTKWLAGFKVGDTTLSGVVELVGGDGVDISVETVGTASSKILISCLGAQSPIGNDVIVDDQTLLDNITARHGLPITKINVGISSSSSNTNDTTVFGGDWNIYTPQANQLSVSVDTDTNSITIEDIGAELCCDDSALNTIVDNIAALNDRAGVLANAQTQLETNLNTIGTQLQRLL